MWGGSNISAEIFGPLLQMTWSVILIAFKRGIKYFTEGSSKSGPGVHFLRGPNISLQA